MPHLREKIAITCKTTFPLVRHQQQGNQLNLWEILVLYLYRTSGVIFFHRLLHSYTRHIERVVRGERDIVPSTQD